jgi:hypothetical protein
MDQSSKEPLIWSELSAMLSTICRRKLNTQTSNFIQYDINKLCATAVKKDIQPVRLAGG